jgi:DNA helicase-2/ATP-dependent DNA helicase PcrA
MDKEVIFAVAGSGKTKYIIDALSLDERSLIVTYTNNNLRTLRRRILL